MARTRRIVKTDDHVVGWTLTALPRFEAVRRGWRRGVGEVKGASTWHEVRYGEVDVGIGVQERGAEKGSSDGRVRGSETRKAVAACGSWPCSATLGRLNRSTLRSGLRMEGFRRVVAWS